MDDFKYILDDMRIAEMMLQPESRSEFYELEAPQKIIDFQFIKASKFFRLLFLFYVTTFIMPNIIAYFADVPLVTRICNLVSLFSLMCFLVIEICQLRQLGAEEYFFDFWNFVDFTQSLVFMIQVYLNFQNDAEPHYVGRMALNLISLFQAFSKGLSFVRLSDEFGFLVKMIGITITELMPFMIFFFFYTSFFSVAFMMTSIDTVKYPRVQKEVGYFLLGLRNSIGDFDQPMHKGWTAKVNDGEITRTEEDLIVFFIWSVWIVQAMFMVIILLNYLIAVIS